ERGIRQVELAGRMSVSAAYVSRVLSGRTKLSVKTVQKIAAALGEPVEMRLSVGPVLQRGETGRGSADGIRAGAGQPSSGDSTERSEIENLTQVALAVLEELPLEARQAIAKKVTKAKARPGRSAGDGLLPDDEALEEMADLLIGRKAKSERDAANRAAPRGEGRATVARRLRRKFAADRENLLTAARGRLPRRVGPERDQPAEHSPFRRGSSGSGYAGRGRSSGALASLKSTGKFLDDLQRRYHLNASILEQLRTPHVLEEAARLAELALSGPAPVTHVISDLGSRADILGNRLTRACGLESLRLRQERILGGIDGSKLVSPFEWPEVKKTLGIDPAIERLVKEREAMKRMLDPSGDLARLAADLQSLSSDED
ncbi:MAG: helix-turn-helix transcriptional regulator, partial [Acidobacteria bacterium]|nr:helix-turn-helix transcriptional regulator [Acidobacteriota bacterium]